MKIQNSPYKNLFGEGNQKEFTTDDGKTYVIKNSPYKNLFGEGNQQIIEEKKDTSWIWELPFWGIVFAFLFLISCVFLLTSIATFELLKIGVCFLITTSLGICFMLATFGKICSYWTVFLVSLQIIGYILLGIAAMILIPLGLIWVFNMFFNFLM